MGDAVNGGLQPQPWHHNIIQARPYPFFPKTNPHLNNVFRHKGAPICPSTASQVLKHFVYIQYGCGMQSMGVFSLNHDIAKSYRLSHTPFSTPTCKRITHKDAPIGPYTVSQGAQTLCIHPIWIWDAVSGGFQPLPWHHNIIQARPYHFFPDRGCTGEFLK